MSKIWVLRIAAAITVVLVAWQWAIWRASEPQGDEPTIEGPVPAHTAIPAKVRPVKSSAPSAADTAEPSPDVGVRAPDTISDMNASGSVEQDEEQKELDRLQAGLDEEDFARVLSAAAVLKRSPSPYVRSKVVESLRWFGQKGLAEIKDFLADADEDVAANALDAFAEAVREIADEPLRAEQLYAGIVTLQSEDAIHELMMQFYECDDAVTLPYIVRLIASENPVAAQAGREAHEHITGEPFVNLPATQKWLDENRTDDPDL